MSLCIQGFIQPLLIVPVLWRKIEFYNGKGESNYEAIVIPARGLGEFSRES